VTPGQWARMFNAGRDQAQRLYISNQSDPARVLQLTLGAMAEEAEQIEQETAT
jgi:hypothetical protein